MTQVDFYILSDTSPQANLATSCRVIEKAWRRQHSVYAHTANREMMQQLDDLLWSFRPNSFIPHRSEDTPEPESASIPDILVGYSGNPKTHDDILINLTEETPEFFGRFKRIAEIVAGEDAAKAKSRERYKYYRKRGYPLNVHHL